MIHFALVVWFVLTALSLVYVAFDAFTHNPELGVMKLGWVLVTLYGGPVAAALYVLSCKEPHPGEHKAFIKLLWKQALGSTVHCIAGDATGIVVAAAITTTLGLPMWQDLIAEYALGFSFGLLIFQALFMKDIMGGSYVGALRRSFLPEWLSMNGVMAGMIPAMVWLMASDMKAMDPGSLRFWGTMSLATLVGGVIAYPVNVWLVAAGLKHGMGTVRALGEGGHAVAADQDAKPGSAAMVHSGHGAMAGMTIPSAPATGTATGNTAAAPAAMEMRAVTVDRTQIVAVTVLTLLALGAGVVVAERSGGFARPVAGTMHGAMDGIPPR